MPLNPRGARYSRWDGSQLVNALSADDLMKAMSDDLMQDGDINRALQRLFRWGFERQDGEHVPGLRELMERVRERRQEQLGKYDLGSMLDEIKQKLEQVVQTERDGIQQKLDAARQTPKDEEIDYADRPAPGGKTSTERGAEANQGQPGAQSQQEQPGAQSQQGQPGQQNQGSQQTTSGQAGEQSGAQASQQGGQSGEGSNEAPDPALVKMLEQMAGKKLEQLDALPNDPAGAIRQLTDYDFMTPEARQQFQDLLAMLQQQMMQQAFQGMEQALNEMTPEDVAQTRQMMQELNEMLEARQRGEPTNFDEFMHRWGHMFAPGINNLDDLLDHLQQRMGAMRQLMESMSPEQRSQLQGMMQAVMQDEGVRQEMDRLGQNLGKMISPDQWRNRHRFTGDEPITMSEAMRMMDRLKDLDDLEQELRDVRDWNDLADIDDDKVRELLGEEEQENMAQLRELTRMLEDAGYIKQNRRGFELTPRGVRKIGEKALNDIFASLQRDRIGQHDLQREGGAGDRTDMTKPYEWGDPFLLDIPKTIMNAVQRGAEPGAGGRGGVQLIPRDFEVYKTEYSTRVSTVLMVDMSRSMLYNGCFNAAKKVALALDSLIRGKYPRDHLSIIGFSYTAQEIQPADLPGLDWNEYNYGTNMQHGFQLARQILGRQKGSNRQIIVITDGEPTAHFENGHVRFSYPPAPRTFQETLREVIRCTRDGITINTFMLERSPYMVQFVNDLMRINSGRVFVATPDRLGEYILVDYVANKRKWVG